MSHITVIDYLLLPIYLYIFYLVVRKRSVKLNSPGLRKHFFTAFALRMFGSIIYSLVIQYYYGYGDSFTFYVGGSFITDQIQNDISNISLFFTSPEELQRLYSFVEGSTGGVNGYIGIGTAVFVMKISALLASLTFNKFLITSLFFGFFSFSGQWKLFEVFNDINEGKHQKLMAWSVLYTPSIWFWGSGLMKDSLCLGGLGFIIYFLYNLFIKKTKMLSSLLGLIFMLYMVGSIKSYILIILGISLATFILLRAITAFKNFIFKAMVVTLFLFMSIIIAYSLNIEEQIQILVEESKVQVDTFQKNYESTRDEGKGTLQMLEIAESPTGLILHSPVAIFTCLFRPFIWESDKIMILFAALESLFLLICTFFILLKTYFLNFLRILFTDPYVLFAFIMSMLFALLIGFTTYNFGTMARYKIILLPFFYFLLVRVYTKHKESVEAKEAVS